MSLFPDEDILTKEIEAWCGFIDKLPTNDDKVILTELLESCYQYSVDIDNHAQTYSFSSESLIMALLLKQNKIINYLKSMQSKAADNQSEDD
jgi:hypothetical protein